MEREMRGKKVEPVSFKRIFNSSKPIADSDQELEHSQNEDGNGNENYNTIIINTGGW
jgi:hypothetical protein